MACGRETPAQALTRAAKIDLDARGSFWDTPASSRLLGRSHGVPGLPSYLPRRRSRPMKLRGELQSSKCSTRLSVRVSQRRPSVRRLPSGCRRAVRPYAWRFLAILVICSLMTGCSTFWRPKPSAGRWWGGSGPNTTAVRKKDDTNDKSRFASWFGSREREKPKTVNEWMAQSSSVHP